VARFTPAKPNAGGMSVPACFPSGRNALTVFVKFGVIAATTPTGENLLHGFDVDAKEVG